MYWGGARAAPDKRPSHSAATNATAPPIAMRRAFFLDLKSLSDRLGACREIKPRPPGRTGRRDRASSVVQIALLFALPASFSRACPSHPGGGASFPDRLLATTKPSLC